MRHDAASLMRQSDALVALFRAKREKRTGEPREFAAEVIRETVAGNGYASRYECTWPQMADHLWRDRVLTILNNFPFMRSARFIGPCDLDSDWVFWRTPT